MFTSKDYRVQETRFDDMRREAARQTQLDAVQPVTDGDQPLYAPTLAGIGGILVEVGSRLQARYGTETHQTPANAC